jgi:hypothetical protein
MPVRGNGPKRGEIGHDSFVKWSAVLKTHHQRADMAQIVDFALIDDAEPGLPKSKAATD